MRLGAVHLNPQKRGGASAKMNAPLFPLGNLCIQYTLMPALLGILNIICLEEHT